MINISTPIGIRFKIPLDYDELIIYILETLDCKRLIWVVETYFEIINDKIDKPKKINPTSFELFNFISSSIDENKYLDLKAYINESDVYDIKSFDDFLISNCKFMLFIYDFEYVYLYFKNNDSLNIVRNAVHSFTNENVEIICTN